MNRQQATALFGTPMVVLLAPAAPAVAADYLTVGQARQAIRTGGSGRPAAPARPAAGLAGAGRDRSARIFLHR